jgi:hypothetical protein
LITKSAVRAVAAVAAGLLLAACSGSSRSASTATQSASPSMKPTSASLTPAPLDFATLVGTAQKAATKFLGLYAAGQYAATWKLIDPGLRKRISEAAWVGVHEACTNQPAGTTYRVSRRGAPFMVMVFAVSPRVANSGQIAFTYGGASQWWYDPSDGWIYFGRTFQQALAVAKAKRRCGS